MIDMMKMFKARMWMKRNVPFLYSWHAYVGYELDLFKAFERGITVADVADAYQIDEILLNQWTSVGVSIGHLKPLSRERYKTGAMWKLPRPKDESSSGVILKEMMELHIPSLLAYPDMMRNKTRNHFDSDKHADTVAQTSRLLEVIALPKIAKLLKGNDKQQVLDIGCGEGGYVKRLAERFPESEFKGIEISESVTVTAERLTESLENVSIEQGDLWDYKSQQTYDLILMNNIIHYISPIKRQELFGKLSELLSDDGILSVITPISGGQDSPPFVATFNSFFHSFENLHELPQKEQLEQWGEGAKLEFLGIQTIIREGSWYVVQYKKSSSVN